MDLRFALDDLYSAGWWPQPGEDYAISEDRRWYPSPEQVGRWFSIKGQPWTLRAVRSGLWRAAWGPPGAGSALAPSPEEAALMSLARAWPDRAPTPSPASGHG